MGDWDFAPHEDILQRLKDEGVEFFDVSKIKEKDMVQYEKILQKIEFNAREDEAVAIAKAAMMRLSL